MLVGLAGLLFAFIYAVERHWPSTGDKSAAPARLVPLDPKEITTIQLRRTNQFILKVDRTNQTWNFTAPLVYAAQSFAIEALLQNLAALSGPALISLGDLNAQHRSIAEFGLDVPAVTLTLQNSGQRTEILFGSRTPLGDQVYMQLLNSSAIYAVSAELFDRLPRSVHDWRDTSLLNLNGLLLDRMEVRAPAKGFALSVNPTNKVFVLTKPTPARADKAKVEALLRKVQTEQVAQFVTDDPRAELETYGLQQPEAELIFGLGTNDSIVVQFGKSPSNDLVYARRMMQTNIVLVSRSLLEAIQITPAELRDRRLLAFSPAAVDTIEVLGEEKFIVRRQTSNTWAVTEPQPVLADAELMREWLNNLSMLEGNVEKDVVTDYSNYGLAQPLRQYILSVTVTNGGGAATNRVLAHLDVGGRQDDKIFARGSEESVYSIKRGDYDRLPTAPWQLRDRRVWSFSTNQVSRVTIRKGGSTRQLVRSASGEWGLAPGSQGVISTFHLEETLFRLGELRAAVWTARTDANRALYGINEDGLKLAIELKNGDKPQTLNLEFGGRAPSQFPYALATVDGQSMVFEFPLPLFFEVIRSLGNLPARTATSGQ